MAQTGALCFVLKSRILYLETLREGVEEDASCGRKDRGEKVFHVFIKGGRLRKKIGGGVMVIETVLEALVGGDF